jgi:type IX secretion system PorP/SprF family membrane protein
MKKVFLFILLLAGTSSFAQQNALFSQYMFNKLVINPAYAGSREVMTFDLLNRYQWVGIEGAPRTITFSGHTPLQNDKMGLGFYVYSDILGPSSDQGFMATYAYRIKLEKGTLAFGLHAGFSHIAIDWVKLDIDDPAVALNGQGKAKYKPDASLGIFYSSNRFYAGFSSTQLLQNEYGMTVTDGASAYSRLTRHFYVMAGYAYPLSEKVVFRPSMLFKYVVNAPMQFELDASFLLNNTLWLGAAYRSKEAIVLLTELNVRHNLRIGYSYDIWFNDLMGYNKGSHEIHVGFDINLMKGRLLNPRYF